MRRINFAKNTGVLSAAAFGLAVGATTVVSHLDSAGVDAPGLRFGGGPADSVVEAVQSRGLPRGASLVDAHTPARDPDARALAALSFQVRERTQLVSPDAELRQIDIDLRTGGQIFRLTDQAATREIAVIVGTAWASPDDWQVVETSVSPLTSGTARPAVELAHLVTGPATAAQALVLERPNADPTSLTLISADDGPVWYVFAEEPAGLISAMVRNSTGVAEVQGPGPAARPITAVPVPRFGSGQPSTPSLDATSQDLTASRKEHIATGVAVRTCAYDPSWVRPTEEEMEQTTWRDFRYTGLSGTPGPRVRSYYDLHFFLFTTVTGSGAYHLMNLSGLYTARPFDGRLCGAGVGFDQAIIEGDEIAVWAIGYRVLGGVIAGDVLIVTVEPHASTNQGYHLVQMERPNPGRSNPRPLRLSFVLGDGRQLAAAYGANLFGPVDEIEVLAHGDGNALARGFVTWPRHGSGPTIEPCPIVKGNGAFCWDPFRLGWHGEARDLAGYRVELTYPGAEERFVYLVPADASTMVFPAEAWPRWQESEALCWSRKDFQLGVVALTADGDDHVWGAFLQSECPELWLR